MSPALHTTVLLTTASQPIAGPPAAAHADAALADLSRAPPLHFLVGQDRLGRWVAVETHGLGGGLFRTRHDALHYADGQTRGLPHAVDLSAEQVELRV